MIWDYHKLLGVMSNYLCSFAISLKMCTDWLEFLCMYMFKAICNTDARGYFLSLRWNHSMKMARHFQSSAFNCCVPGEPGC